MSIKSKNGMPDGWAGWQFCADILVSPAGETFKPSDLSAVYIAWQQNSALKQERARLSDQLAQARSTRPKCPTSWHRFADPPPPQMPLWDPQKSPV